MVCLLIGGVWLGQGMNLIPGSYMSGQMMWAVIGLAVLAVGVWLLWSLLASRRGPV